MGFDVKAWLSSKLLGTTGPQRGVSSYRKSKATTRRELDEAEPNWKRRGDSEGDYDPYSDRDLDYDLPEQSPGLIGPGNIENQDWRP